MKREQNKTGDDSVSLYAFSKREILLAVLVAVILLAGLWIWKTLQIKSLREEHSNQEQAIIKQANDQLEDKSKQFLKLVSMPYVWAIRTEMMQGNTSQLSLYGNSIVKEKNFVSVMVVNEQGKIISSTDKKYEGKDFISLRSPFYTNVNRTVVNKINDSLLTVASPVMGFNSRLGTLIINYTVNKIGQ